MNGDEFTGPSAADEIAEQSVVPERNVISDLIEKFTSRPTETGQGVGSFLYEAIYQFGRGRAELAFENIIRKSKAGRAAISNIERERRAAMIPWLIGGGFLLVFVVLLVARR